MKTAKKSLSAAVDCHLLIEVLHEPNEPSGPRCSRLAIFRSSFDHDGHDRGDDDANDDEVEMLFDARNPSRQKVTSEQERPDPQHSADDIVCRKLEVIHPGNSGDGWGKGAHDGNKAGQNNRLAAMPVIEFLSLEYMAFAKEKGLLALEQKRAGLAADLKAGQIADNCSSAEHEAKHPDVDKGIRWRFGDKQTSRQQERIPGQKKADQQPGFGKDDSNKANCTGNGNEGFKVMQIMHSSCNGLHYSFKYLHRLSSFCYSISQARPIGILSCLRLAFKLQGDLAMTDKFLVLPNKAHSALLSALVLLSLGFAGCMQATPPLAPRPPAPLSASERQLANYSSERALVGSPGRPRCLLTTDQIAALGTLPVPAGEVTPLALSQDLITFSKDSSKIVACTQPEVAEAGKPEYRVATLLRCSNTPSYLTCERESTTSSQGDSWKCLPADGSSAKPEDSEVAQPGC